jgi:hypothetical protein
MGKIKMDINKSTQLLIKEKYSILKDYAKDSGLKMKEVKEAIEGFKRLQLGNPFKKLCLSDEDYNPTSKNKSLASIQNHPQND